MMNRHVISVFLVFMIGFLSDIPELKASVQNQPNRIVTGKVVSIDDQPMEGVNVQIKGKGRGTITDASGMFNLSNVVLNDVLTFTYVGYITQEIPLQGRKNLKVTLVHSLEKLEEVVVVGYGTIAKSDFTGSSSRIDLEGVENNRFASPLEALQGRVAGAHIITNTGEPGAGMTFNIRGISSITGSTRPLIVIDGQPVESGFGATMAGNAMDGGQDISPSDPLANLNPADIESIEVLKDASSTAIYGSRGANGVVLITTKSGKLGRDRIVYNTRFDYNTLPKKIDVLNSIDYMYFRNEAALNSGQNAIYTQNQIDSISQAVNVNWQDLIYKDRISQEHQLSISGRGDRDNYFISGNFADQDNLIQNAGFKRYGLRLNYERKVSDKFTVSLRSFISSTNRQYGQQGNWTGIPGSNAVLGALIYTPLQSATNEEGMLDETFNNNPVLVTTLVKDNTAMRTIVTNMNMSYKFNKNFTYTLKAGVNSLYALREVYYPKGTFIGNTAPGGSASRADNDNINYLLDNLLSYNQTFDRKHRINAVAGFSYQLWENKASSVTSTTFPSGALSYYNLQSAAGPGRMYTFYKTRALQSVLGRVNYAYDRRYLLTLTARSDGATRLADGRKWAFFPSVGLGWNISNEKFFSNNIDVVNNLKLRGSFGITGNENIAIGASLAKYGTNYAVIGGNIVTGYIPNDFENPYLTWETTRQFNLGLDGGLMKDRITFSIDLYHRETNDLLINLSLPTSSGYGSYYTNVGKIKNKGLDIEASYKILTGKLKWDAGANFSVLRNEVVHMGELPAIYGRQFLIAGGVVLGKQIHIAMPGKAIPTFWGYQTDGIYQNAQEVADGPEASTAKPGDVKWVDTNQDGKISELDREDIGNPLPDFTYGFNTNLSYKSFSFSMVLMGSHGNKMINLNNWIIGANNSNGNFNSTRAAYEGRWTGEGTSNLYPRLTTSPTRLNQRLPDWMVEDASFFRVQSVTLDYTFGIAPLLKSTKIRAFLSGTNLLTLTKYSGYDPNTNAFGNNVLNSGVDFGTLPQPRTFSAGLEITF